MNCSGERTRSGRGPAVVVLVVAVTLGAFAAPAAAGRATVVATVRSPEQVVTVHFEDGTTAPATFQSSLRVYSTGLARGTLQLRVQDVSGAPTLEFTLSYRRGQLYRLQDVLVVSYQASGEQCVSGVCRDVRVSGSVHPDASSPDCLIYDVVGPLVRDAHFDATGTFVLGP